jgi:transposase
MTRTNLDDAQWASLMLVIQRIAHVWKRSEAGLRRFITAVLWVLRTVCHGATFPTLALQLHIVHIWLSCSTSCGYLRHFPLNVPP